MKKKYKKGCSEVAAGKIKLTNIMKRKQAEADKPEKKLRWDVPKTASLISFYKEHPELWNPRVPEYSNDKLRLKAVEAWLLENQLEPEKGT